MLFYVCLDFSFSLQLWPPSFFNYTADLQGMNAHCRRKIKLVEGPSKKGFSGSYITANKKVMFNFANSMQK
jgi:hypothetical protein